MDEEQEINTQTTLNDVRDGELWNEVDISAFFEVVHAKVFKKIFKKNTQDLMSHQKKNIFLSIFPKIKILKLRRPGNVDIIKKKKIAHIDLYDGIVSNKKQTLNLRSEKEQHPQEIFDFLPPVKKPLFQSQWVKKSAKLYISILVWVVGILWIYGFFTKSYIMNTLQQAENLQLDSYDHIKSQTKNLSHRFFVINILLKPITWANLVLQNQIISQLSLLMNGVQEVAKFWSIGFDISDKILDMMHQRGAEDIMYSQLLDNIFPLLVKMQSYINNSQKSFSQVQSFWNEALFETFKEYRDLITTGAHYFNLFVDNFSTFQKIIWHDEKKTYMIVLQNNDEIRPTWGFMWSVYFVDIFRGKIENLESKDIYALEWELKDFATKNGIAFEKKAPEGIDTLSKTFWLRDANYFPSIQESSEEIQSFLSKSNYTIDGILYMDQNIILNLLKHTWPIFFPEINREVTAENFSVIFSTLVEAKISKTHTLSTPKQIVFDFGEILKQKLLAEKNYSYLIQQLYASFKKRDISLYLFDASSQNFLSSFFDNTPPKYDTLMDFSYPVFTSIWWNKSDRYISRTFQNSYSISENCSIQSEFWIELRHNFNLNQEIYIKNLLYDFDGLVKENLDTLLDIQWRGSNKVYMRVLLPKDAKILPQKNMSIVQKDTYQEVQFYLSTSPTSQTNYTISYTLPNPSCLPYSYRFIKQPGIQPYLFELKKDWYLINSSYNEADFIYHENF